VQVAAFGREMSARSADWQVQMYGNNTDHAFTVPGARYQPQADARSWASMKTFFNEDYA
jgi:dienelactone hydrolase